MSSSSFLISNTIFGVICGTVPAVAMLLSSILMMNITVNSIVESILQNFAAGLIVAAVAGELFPLLASVQGFSDIAGTTIGFTIALAFLYGVESLIDSFGHASEYAVVEKSSDEIRLEAGYYQLEQNPKGDWEMESINQTLDCISDPNHRSKISEKLNSVNNSIAKIEYRANALSSDDLTAEQVESLGEEIDKEIHQVHHNLDQSRRLFESSVTNTANGKNGIKFSTEKTKLIQARLKDLKSVINHIQEHLTVTLLNQDLVREIHGHMEDADHRLTQFHNTVEDGFTKWKRSRPFLPTPIGSTLPIGMIIPIFIDGVIDGFLIGVTCSISRGAGIILAFANCIEMSLLGMALSSRVAKCTGSSLLMRYGSIAMPPLLMIYGSFIGSYLGDTSKDYPMLFVGFVSFGVVALLYLVCNELLIEAADSQGDKKVWWVNITFFIGVYIVIIMDSVLPGLQ